MANTIILILILAIDLTNFHDIGNEQFQCLNRVDQKDILFEKSIERERPKGRKLSILLNHTEEYFTCGEVFIYWKNISLLDIYVST